MSFCRAWEKRAAAELVDLEVRHWPADVAVSSSILPGRIFFFNRNRCPTANSHSLLPAHRPDMTYRNDGIGRLIHPIYHLTRMT